MDPTKRYCKLQVTKKKYKRMDKFLNKQNETCEQNGIACVDKNSARFQLEKFINDVKKYAEKFKQKKEKELNGLQKRNLGDSKVGLTLPNKRGLFENAVISTSIKIRGSNTVEERRSNLSRLKGDMPSLSPEVGNSTAQEKQEVEDERKSENSFVKAHSKIVEKIINCDDSDDIMSNEINDDVLIDGVESDHHDVSINSVDKEQSEKNKNIKPAEDSDIVNTDAQVKTPDYRIVKTNEWSSEEINKDDINRRHFHEVTSHRDVVEGKILKRSFADNDAHQSNFKDAFHQNKSSVSNEGNERNILNYTSTISDILTKHYNLPKFKYPLEYVMLHNEFCQLEMKKLSTKLKEFGEKRGHINYSDMVKKIMREMIKKRMEEASPPPESSKLGSDASFLYKSVYPHGVRNYFYCNPPTVNLNKESHQDLHVNLKIPEDSTEVPETRNIKNFMDVGNDKNPFISEFYSNCVEHRSDSYNLALSPDMNERVQRICKVNEQLNENDQITNKRYYNNSPMYSNNNFDNIFSPLNFSMTPVKGRNSTNIQDNFYWSKDENLSPMGSPRSKYCSDNLIPRTTVTPRRNLTFSPLFSVSSSINRDNPNLMINTPIRFAKKRRLLFDSPLYGFRINDKISPLTNLRNKVKFSSPLFHKMNVNYNNSVINKKLTLPQISTPSMSVCSSVVTPLSDVKNKFLIKSPLNSYPVDMANSRNFGVDIDSMENDLQPSTSYISVKTFDNFKLPRTPVNHRHYRDTTNYLGIYISPLQFMEFNDCDIDVKPPPHLQNDILHKNIAPYSKMNRITPLFSPHNF